jgi:aminopeptidase N
VTSNLTRDEAAARSALITVASYHVDLDLTGGDEVFRSVSVVKFGCRAPGSASFINLTAPAVHEITLNGQQVSLAAFDGDRITLEDLAADNVLRVVADCAYSRSGEGLHRFTDPADGRVYLYSDLETFDAHRVYACFDQPDMKATYELAVTAPADWIVVSNMAPESSIEDVQARRWHFPPTPVLPTYITAVAAGPYHVVRDEHDGIPLGLFCRQSLASYLDPDEILTVTRPGFDF